VPPIRFRRLLLGSKPNVLLCRESIIVAVVRYRSSLLWRLLTLISQYRMIIEAR